MSRPEKNFPHVQNRQFSGGLQSPGQACALTSDCNTSTSSTPAPPSSCARSVPAPRTRSTISTGENNFNSTCTLTSPSIPRNPITPVNWFVQIGISPQTLTSFVPEQDVWTTSTTYVRSDQRAQSSVFWISATPGFYFSLGENRRLLLGARLMKEVLSESSKPGIIVIPMFQFDWKL